MSLKGKKYNRTLKTFQSTKMDCEKLRTYEGFENVSEQEAKSVIEQLEALANILYKQLANE